MSGIVNGQQVDESNSNAAWLAKNGNDATVGIVALQNTDPASGTTIDNIQREVNAIDSYTGNSQNAAKTVKPSWSYNDVGSSTDDLKTRGDALTHKFNSSTGHTHTGAAGDAPPISSVDIISVPLVGVFQQGTTLTSVTGGSTTVTTQMSGKSASSGSTAKGVVTTSPYNKVVLRQGTGASTDDPFKDGSGNIVYGRVTESSGVWTLTYYVDLSGTETAYSFSGSNTVKWFYQQLFNPIVDAPVYSVSAFIPSDNATADVIDATTSLKGKVQLATTAQPVGSSTSAGTANASVANEDHTHQGVHSVSKSGSTALNGDVTFTGTNGASLTQTSQNIAIDAPALASATPQAISATAAVGTGTTSARADHVHEGLHQISDGSTSIKGDATISGAGGTSTSAVGQTLTVTSPALSSTSPSSVGSSNSVGSGATTARSDHAHQGVHSVSKSGSGQLTGDATFTGSGGTTLSQVSQNIDISSPALTSTAPNTLGTSNSVGTSTESARADHTHSAGTIAIGNGGTGQTTQQNALDAIAGAVTSGQYLRGNGTHVSMSAIQAADVPTLNQNTTGTASNVTGTVAIGNGGTGQTTANAALNALLPSQTGNATKYLQTDGTNTSWAASSGGFTSPLTTKGDIHTYSTTDTRQPVGSNGQILSSDSTQTTGLKWVANGTYPYADKTASYTLTASDTVVDFDTSAGLATATLPTASGITGKTYTIKLTVAGNPLNITGTSGQTIDGFTTITLSNVNDFITVIADGTNWLIINKSIMPINGALTSTGGFTGYRFTITSGSATRGATYTNNGNTFTVQGTIVSQTTLFCDANGSPTASGTLTKATGTGDATITFSAFTGTNTILPTAGTKWIKIKMVGGGAGGSGSGTGNSGGNGASGTPTTFGPNMLTANGGVGSTVQYAAVAGGTASISGVASGIALTGAWGGASAGGVGSAGFFPGGQGSATPFGGGGSGTLNGAGTAGTANTGSGGGGGGNNNVSGSNSGVGGSAAGYIEAILPYNASSYNQGQLPYAIGAGGAGGSAGTSGLAGGAGGSGVIYYEFHF